MKEEFLHYLWWFKLLHPSLYSTKNEKIEIINPGMHNRDAGPDFTEAQVRIDNTLWAGNIELHLNASDWIKHQHHKDKAYNTTILHVVYNCDMEIKLENGEEIACLELKDKFNPELLDKYEGFLRSKKWIVCSGQLSSFPKMKLSALYSRMSVERLEEKTNIILERLERNKNDWEETFYQLLAGGFGLKINQDVFIRLAESLPLKKVVLQQTNLFQIEALLFGQSGLLQMQDLDDDYPRKLTKEYTYLSKKYSLQPLPGHLWKYLRLRPVNFPTKRIAQFAVLLSQNQNLFSKMLENENIKEFILLFKSEASPYWSNHYVWDKPSKTQNTALSADRINLLLINIIIPFLFLYGKQRNQNKLVERALDFLDLIPAEKNNITNAFKKEGLHFESAFQTQAFLQLKANYCDFKKCLSCPIGLYLIK